MFLIFRVIVLLFSAHKMATTVILASQGLLMEQRVDYVTYVLTIIVLNKYPLKGTTVPHGVPPGGWTPSRETGNTNF